MNDSRPIHQIAAEFRLTSRTLRYWEEKGLIRSDRDEQSGWRTYCPEMLQRIRLVMVLRELDLPIRAIKSILESADPVVATKQIKAKIDSLNEERILISNQKGLLDKCLAVVHEMRKEAGGPEYMTNLEKLLSLQRMTETTIKKDHKEDIIMTNTNISSGAVRIIKLPEMRVAVCNIISAAPEEEALGTITKWLEQEKLESTARIFGFNTTAYQPEASEYGWAACATIPEHVQLPSYLTEKRLPGGSYASFNSTNEVYDSWQTFMRLLKDYEGFEVDKSRPCLEEHIRSGEDSGSGNDFYLNLLEPVSKK